MCRPGSSRALRVFLTRAQREGKDLGSPGQTVVGLTYHHRMASVKRYVAFLRGINVGGHKVIKMEELRYVIGSISGFEDVQTYIQSGNVVFDSCEGDAKSLAETIESQIQESCGFEVAVFLRTTEELGEITAHDHFRPVEKNTEVKKYITFLSQPPTADQESLIASQASDDEVFELGKKELFTLLHPTDKEPRFSNNFIEKLFEAPATTRNLNTVTKIFNKFGGV